MADTKETKAADTKAPAAAKPAAPAAGKVEDVVVRGRVATDATAAKSKAKVEKTGANTHIATQRGYSVVDGGGVLVEPGEFVPAGTPISLAAEDVTDPDDPRYGVGWMKKVKKAEREKLEANAEALQRKPKDVDLTQASTAAIEALCLMEGINVGGLDRDGLIAAYTAHRENDAG